MVGQGVLQALPPVLQVWGWAVAICSGVRPEVYSLCKSLLLKFCTLLETTLLFSPGGVLLCKKFSIKVITQIPNLLETY